MKKVHLGIIGLGTVFIKKHLPALLTLKDIFDVRYVYTSDPQKFKNIQTHYAKATWCASVKDLLKQEDMDTVVACVPLPRHYAVLKQVIHSQKNVMVEKPMVHNRSFGTKVLELVKKNNMRLMVAENFRYLSSLEQLKKKMDAGVLGEIKLVQVHAMTCLNDTNAYYQRPWRLNPQTYPGILWEGGIHFVSVLRYLFQQVEWRYRKFSSINPRLGQYDTVLAYARLEKKIDAGLTISYSIDQQEDTFLKIYGTRGNAQCGMSALSIQSEGKTQKWQYPFEEYEKIYKEFHAFVTSSQQPRYSLQDAYGDINTLDKLFKA